MSKESMQSLHTNTVQGYGFKPWHFREGQSREPFEGAVPEEFVQNMFPHILEVPNGYQLATGEWVNDTEMKTLLRADTMDKLATVSESYAPHQYTDTLLGMGLPIASAGLLRAGRNAWVQYGTADTVITPDNVAFTTKLLTVTSADATIATQFKYVTTMVVCDNTLESALGERSKARKVRHTRFSVPRVDDMRAAFGLLEEVSEDVSEAITAQVNTTVTDKQLSDFLDTLLPASVPDSEVEGRARTIAVNKREAVNARLDSMWSDYKGTEFGTLQAFDTALRWDFRTTDPDKTMGKVITGDFDKAMNEATRALALVTA